MVLAVVVGLAAGCTRGAPSTPAQSTGVGSVGVSGTAAATLRLASGATVAVSRGAVTGEGTLTGEAAAPPVALPETVRSDGPVYRFELSGTAELVGGVTLTLPVSPVADSSSPDVAMLAFLDEQAGAWVPVQAEYDKQAHRVTATVDHFSFWTVLRLDTTKVLKALKTFGASFFGVADLAGQPACPRESEGKKAGLTVKSDSGNLVKWCAGLDPKGRPLLRITANRQYAMEVDYPFGWAVRRVGDADLVTTQITDAVAKAVTSTPRGQSAVIVAGGATVELIADERGAGRVSVLPSPPAYLASALLFGVETLAMTFGAVPGAPKPDPSRTAKAVQLLFAGKSCVTDMIDLTRRDVTSPSAVGDMFRSLANLAVGCLSDQWEIAYGIRGFVASFLAGVVLWFVDGVKLVLDGFRAAIDTAIYWRTYRIVLALVPSLALTASGVGPIEFGAAGSAAEAKLRDLLGAPTKVTDQGFCALGLGDPGRLRRLAWGPLAVWLTGPHERGDDITLTAWEVTPGAGQVVVDLPHDLKPGDTYQDVLDAVPGAEQRAYVGGASELVDPDGVEYLFDVESPSASEKVTSVSYGVVPCD